MIAVLLVHLTLASIVSSFRLSNDTRSAIPLLNVAKLRICGPYMVVALNTTGEGFRVYEWLQNTNKIGRQLADFKLTPKYQLRS